MASIALQDVPYLQELAPSLYTAAKSAAQAAKVPVAEPKDIGNGTVNTFMIRTTAQMVSLGSGMWGSAQALFGQDNSQMLEQIDDANRVLRTIDCDTKNGSTSEKNFASAARAADGLLGGIAMIETNFAGVVFRDIFFAKTFFNGSITTLPSQTEFLQMDDSNATSRNDNPAHAWISAKV